MDELSVSEDLQELLEECQEFASDVVSGEALLEREAFECLEGGE